MKKRFLLLIFLFSILISILVSSCKSPASDPFDPPDFTPTKAPTDWSTIASDAYVHTKVAAVALDKVPARKIELPKQQSPDLIRPVSDGGCLAVSQVLVDANDKSGNPSYYLRVIRFKADGSVLWDKQYKSDPFQGYLQKMCVFADDEFAVSLQVQLNNSTLYSAVGRLCRFSAKGELLWKTREDQMIPGALDYIFAAQDGAVIAAGMLAVTNPDGSFNNNDIWLLCFEKDGTLSIKSSIGTPGNDNLMDAAYSAGTGLLLSWRKEVDGNPVVSGVAMNQASQLSCFGEDLKERWTSEMPSNEQVFEVFSLPDAGGALVIATLLESTSDPAVTTSLSVLIHFSNSGERIWSYSVQMEKAWIMASTRLTDGRFVTGWFQNTDRRGEESNLAILSPVGAFVESLGPIPGIVQQLVSTKDGGFTVILRQTVSALPQPPYISSIWTDTEAVIAHYDSKLNLVWQRSIDQYKHELRSDIVVPTIDAQLLIG